MVEKNSKSSSVKDRLAALAIAMNTLLAVKMRECSEVDDSDAFSVCLAAMAKVVGVFDGAEAATKMVDAYTGGAFSEMEDLVDGGATPEDAARAVTVKMEDSDVS